MSSISPYSDLTGQSNNSGDAVLDLKIQCDKMLRKYPEHPLLVLFRGMCLGYLGDHKGMMFEVERVREKHPKHPEAVLLYAWMMTQQQEFKAAQRLLIKGEKLLDLKKSERYIPGEKLNAKEKAQISLFLGYHRDAFFTTFFSGRLKQLTPASHAIVARLFSPHDRKSEVCL